MARQNAATELSAEERAEDIILGGLGFGEDARIVSLERCSQGFRGEAAFSDGERSPFASDEAPSEIEEWALNVLLAKLRSGH